MLELLSEILEAADTILMDKVSLSLFPGEYGDGTQCPPDITEVNIEIDRMYTMESDLPGLTVKVSTQEQGGWIAYLDNSMGDMYGYLATTLEGYCTQNCDCPMCDVMRSQNEVA